MYMFLPVFFILMCITGISPEVAAAEDHHSPGHSGSADPGKGLVASQQEQSMEETQKGFLTGNEFIAHTRGESGCSTPRCHAGFSDSKRFPHEPVRTGECDICHTSQAYPSRYGVGRDQMIVCSGCHRKLEEEIQGSQFVHGPIKNGDCTSCHDPHGSGRSFFLKESYSNLCSTCHNLKRLYAGKFIHKPVQDGNCGLCHDPHASNFRWRLTDTGANLCVMCHEDMVIGMTSAYVHEPLLKSGCSDCHDPHSGESKLRLKTDPEKLCVRCHEEKKNEISQYRVAHEPAVKGQCVSCHSPHFSERRYLLIDKTDSLCFRCHKDKSVWKSRKVQHGPVVQGNCSACHNPHGSDNAFILRMSFPLKFYASYKKGEYNLCFNCHKEALVTTEKTVRVTNFRNGDTNLHMLHVNQKKGRTCRACHDVHASDQEDHIRENFLFGTATIPIEYFKSETGGKCIPGCHRERAYDRINRVVNKN